MPGAADFACAILTAPATALLVIVGGVVLALVAGEDTIDAGILAGFGAYVVVPPTAVVLRARSRGLDVEAACLLLVLTLVSMATTVAVLVGAMSVAYGYVMSDF